MSWWKSNIIRKIAKHILSGIELSKKMSNFNWYRKYVLAAGFTAWVDNDVASKNRRGNGPAFVIGNSYSIKDQLSAMGFRWDMAGRSGWFLDVNTLKGNQQAINKLQSLGVPLNTIGMPVNIQPVRPSQPVQRYPQRPVVDNPSNSVADSPSGQIWYLAKVKNLKEIPTGSPVILSAQKDGSWKWVDKSYIPNLSGQVDSNIPTGLSGLLSKSEVSSSVVSIKDENGTEISSTNPSELFAIFENMNKKTEDTVVDPEKYKDRSSAEDARMKPEHVTVYNAAIREKFLKTSDNIMINALAGTGKTAQLKDIASFKNPNERWLYLVFNKKNQVESQNNFPAGVDVMTTHSFLGQVLDMSDKSVGGDMRLQQSRPGQKSPPRKIGVIAKAIISPTWPDPYALNKKGNRCIFNWNASRKAMKVAELSKQFGVNPNDSDAMNRMLEIVRKYQIDMDVSTLKETATRDYTKDILQKSLEILQGCMPGQLPRGVDKRYASVRDHDDTLWLPTIFTNQIDWAAKKLGYDVVLMDEVQDFNICQINMAQNLKNAGSRMVGVGDPNQALYYFRGADNDAFDKLIDILTDGKSEPMPLPINWRSDEAILDYTKQRTGIEVEVAPHKKGKGMINTVTKSTDFLDNLITGYKNNNNMLERSTAIISPTNAPLIGVALHLLKNNVEFEIVGRDLYQNLERVIKEAVFSADQVGIDDMRWKLGDHLDKVKGRWGRDLSKQDEVKETEEFVTAIASILDYLDQSEYKDPSNPNSRPMRNGGDFLLYLKSKIGGVNVDNGEAAAEMSARLNDENAKKKKVQLTTAHRSKGFEYDAVGVLGDKKFTPNKKGIPDWEKRQLKNAQYVAYTRAKNELWVFSDDDKE